MEKGGEKIGLFSGSLDERLSQIAEEFLKQPKEKEIQVISHFDTDGITSASIIIKCLQKLDRKFSTIIVKNLDAEVISRISEEKMPLFIDLASNSLDLLGKFKKVFVIDHHEVTQKIPENISIANPQLHESKEEISSSGLCYLFAKKINPANRSLASLAIIGMIGDSVQNIGISNNEIMKDAEVLVKKGVLLYPSTRPLNKVLEFSSEPYIPSVTGNKDGVFQMLKEIGFERENGQYKSLIELSDEEMTKIVTAILLRRLEKNNENLIGNIFLVKHFNQIEDAREISAKINASSRLGEPYTAILYCLEDAKAKKQVEKLYAKYRQMIINGLNSISGIEQIKGNGFVILNAKSVINDSMISVITTILSKSSLYNEGMIIVAMSSAEDDKIKVSGRTVGKGRNVREILARVMADVGGEFGGHKYAAGCMFDSSKEGEFIERLKKELEIELVKI
ncbi:MAG TPA: DHH family phosphoesterase [Candidatus Omnitrophota bacterium]|nr:DHH family phosphoesterase [Candidatus Omnitrophota bacterium]